MIRIEDLLAARAVYQQRPELRGVLAKQLRALDRADGAKGQGFSTLLGELVRQGLLNREQAEYVYGLVERVKRGRALGVFNELLVREGKLERGAVQALVHELGDAATCERVSEAVIARGLLDSGATSRIRFRAKQVSDQDERRQVEAYRGRHQAETAHTLVGEGAEETGADTETDLGQMLIPSGVYKTDAPVIPSEAEATGIIDRASLDLTPPLEYLAPRFPIPDWIDTTDEKVGSGVGDYRILGRVGSGAMGTVYLCDHTDRETPVALKILSPAATQEAKARFKREILANGFFEHPNVLDVYDAGQTGQGHYYLAMEFFDGADLENVLETEDTLSLRQTIIIARQILQALGAAHRAGIVHRDVKPGNILVSPAGDTAKLMDFGIALISDLGEFKAKVFESDAGGVTGTPEYLSPEQAFRDPVGPPADLYSMGMVLYRMLAGRLPFESETVTGWINCHIAEDPLPITEASGRTDLPGKLVRLFERLFVKDPKERIQTADEVVAILDDIRASLSEERKSRFFSRFRRGF